MTREEAINWLNFIKYHVDNKIMAIFDNDSKEALDMAIEALHREEAEEKGYCHRIRPKGERSEP